MTGEQVVCRDQVIAPRCDRDRTTAYLSDRAASAANAGDEQAGASAAMGSKLPRILSGASGFDRTYRYGSAPPVRKTRMTDFGVATRAGSATVPLPGAAARQQRRQTDAQEAGGRLAETRDA